ncbi:protein vreteno [Uranotaenia lowii]|uniref:protein vreteno n=1 Tax=Uranotaenia lowii TaxID=190385 RepID=UPI002479DD14|nr:protein vreteno [Uranotaenia lowii]
MQTVINQTTPKLDDDLDQMRKDFYDPELNRYDTGPGADLEDSLQPGALAAAAALTSKISEKEMVCRDRPAVKIRLINTRDLTDTGLTELCKPYGTVMSVHRPRNDNNQAFIEFTNQNEAGFAIQELSRKLGFQFYPAFAHEKRSNQLVDVGLLAPPPPVESEQGKNNATSLDPSLDDDSWERTLAQRRIKIGFSIPLKIRFPEVKTLATSSHYKPVPEKVTALARTDPQQIFSIVALLNSEPSKESQPRIDTKIGTRIIEMTKREGVQRLAASDSNGSGKFVFRGLTDEQRSLFKDSHCVNCGHRGFFTCGLCGAPYCSKHCQEQDFEKHQPSCKGEPDVKVNGKAEEKAQEETISESLEQEGFPKGAHVMIVSVMTPDRVWVRALDRTSNREYLQTLSDIANHALTAERVSNTPQAGDICLAMYEPLNVYARVLVTRVIRSQAHCVFIDFGIVKRIGLGSLKKISDLKLKFRKVRIHKVHLKGITDEHGHIEKAMSYLNDLIGQPLEMKVQLEGGNLVDAALRTATGINVNKRINDLITIPIVNVVEAADKFIDYKTVRQKRLPANTKIDIMVLNRTTIKLDFRVTIIAFEDLPYVEDIQCKLQCYGKKVQNFSEFYTPRLNELCLVRNMDIWYRAVCVECVGDGRPSVYLVDFGSLIMARLEDIRKLPPSLAMEVRTTDAKVYQLEEAQKSGVTIDSEFLDIYLEENERMTVETTEEAEFKEFVEALARDDTPMVTVIKVPDFLSFLADRADCADDMRVRSG